MSLWISFNLNNWLRNEAEMPEKLWWRAQSFSQFLVCCYHLFYTWSLYWSKSPDLVDTQKNRKSPTCHPLPWNPSQVFCLFSLSHFSHHLQPHLQSQSPSEELFDSQDAPQASVAFPHSQVPPHNSWTVPGDSPAIHPYVGTLRAPDPKVETTNPDYSHILSCIMFVSLED